MSIANVTETAILALIFNATTWANYAINASSSPETAIGNALHTADPGETGNASTSEVAYTSYARVDVNRNSGGWTVTNNSVSPRSAGMRSYPSVSGTLARTCGMSARALGAGPNFRSLCASDEPLNANKPAHAPATNTNR